MNTHRLTEMTHALCRRALSGEFGKEMAEHYCATVDAAGFEFLSPWQQYNACLEAIVEQAPVRLVDGELLACSATLDKAREHQVPAALSGADPEAQLFKSQSHLTPHYHKVIRRGLRGLLAVYNDDTVIEALTRFGYSPGIPPRLCGHFCKGRNPGKAPGLYVINKASHRTMKLLLEHCSVGIFIPLNRYIIIYSIYRKNACFLQRNKV